MKIKSIKYILLLLLLFIFKDFWKIPYLNLVLTYKKVLIFSMAFLGLFMLYDITSLLMKNELVRKHSELIRKYKKYILVLLLFVLLVTLSKLPYLNIVLLPWEIFLVTWIVGIYLLKIKSWVNYLFAILLLFGALILMLIGRMGTAEQIGNLIYVLLLVGFIQDTYLYLRSLKEGAEH